MDYTKVYNSIITKARTQDRKKGKETYYESHHIVPRCMGGTDVISNLVLLTAREHYICHKLLTKMYPDNTGLVYAWWCMAVLEKKGQTRHKISSKEYHKLKTLYTTSMSKDQQGENNNAYGTTHTEEWKKNHSECISNKWKDPVYRKKVGAPYKGKKHSKETRQQISKSKTGKTRPEFSSEWKHNLSNVAKGGKNPFAKKILLDDVTYDSMSTASEVLGISYYLVKKRCTYL